MLPIPVTKITTKWQMRVLHSTKPARPFSPAGKILRCIANTWQIRRKCIAPPTLINVPFARLFPPHEHRENAKIRIDESRGKISEREQSEKETKLTLSRVLLLSPNRRSAQFPCTQHAPFSMSPRRPHDFLYSRCRGERRKTREHGTSV